MQKFVKMLAIRSLRPYLVNYRLASGITGTDGTGGLADLDKPSALSKFIKDPIKIKRQNVHYVSCPIFYATSKPHIGHIHTAIIGDFFHRYDFWSSKKNFTNFFSRRWHHLHGVKSVLSVGTDEHGQKIIRTANQLGYDHPQNLVDEVSQEYIKTFHKFNISFERGM